MSTTLIRGAFACVLLTTTALIAPALAQTATPPRFQSVDANGVDLISGFFLFDMVEGSIGAGDGAVSLSRSQRSDYGRRDQWSGTLFQRTAGGTTEMVATFGGQSDTFTVSGGTYTATKANGATLASSGGGFVYTAADGTTVTFGVPTSTNGSPLTGAGCTVADPASCMIPMAVTRPNGTSFTPSWDVVELCTQYDSQLDCLNWVLFTRLAGVASSTGYGFTLSYMTALATSPNWHVRTGATFTNSVTAPPTNPTVTYAAVSAGVEDVTDTNGRTWRITASTTSGLITGIRRPGSSADDISVSYGSGGIVSAVTADGITTNYSRSVSGSTATTTITDAQSNVTIVVADLSLGRITAVTDPLSRTATYAYDGNSRLTRATSPEGNSIGYSYDARGNVTETRLREKDDTDDTGDDIVMTASYDSSCSNVVTCNQPNSVTDARGHTTDYTYDSTHGGLLSVTAPAPSGSGTRPQTRYAYTQSDGEYRLTGVSGCAAGSTSSPTCVGTSDETRIVIGYDANGNATSVEQRSGNSSGAGALSATSTMTYDGYGNLLTTDGPLSGTADTIRYRYNAARQAIGVIGPDPDGGGSLHHRAVRTTYGADGQPTKVERGTVASQSDGDWSSFSTLEEVQAEYDSHHRPVVQRLVSGSTTHALAQTSYDSLGRVQCVAQRMNSSEFGSLPSDACTLDSEGSYGPDRIARTTYDGAGQVTKVETGYGVSGVAADEVATTYSSNGRVATLTDAEGNRTTYEYDGFDRLVKTRYPSTTQGAGTSSTTDYEELTLDAAGNVTNRRLRDDTNIGFTYDHLGRVTEKDLPGSEPDIAYAYDLFGRMSSAANSGYALSFTYDALGRNLTQAGPLGTTGYAYDVAGRRTRLTYPGSGLYVDYDYLVTGEISVIRENGATSGVGVLGTYAYDDRGRRTALTRGNGTTTTYTYDDVSRVTQLVENLSGTDYDQTLGFTPNPAGQIASTTRSNDTYAWTGHYAINRAYTTNGLNQYSASGSLSPTYDGRGNVQTAGSSTYYIYNSENMLTSAWNQATLNYDPLLRLFQVAGASATRMLYDGATLIGEYDSSHNLQRRYVHGPGTDEPLVWYEGTGTGDRRFYHADERGSIVATSDSSGAMLTVNTYDEYGIPGSGNSGRFQYTGQQWLGDIGMYHYRARIYSPTLGRFLQTDPIGFEGGMNLYAYVLNDPVNMTDPTGLDPICYQVIIPGWTDRSDPDEPVVSGRKSREVCRDATDTGGDEKQNLTRTIRPPRLICTGRAYVMAGNPRLIGRVGFPNTRVTAGSAAVIPHQFTGEWPAGPVMRRIGAGAWGVTAGGQRFRGITDAIAYGDLGRAQVVQTMIMDRHPGYFVLELVSGHHEEDSFVKLSLPAGTPRCPNGTTRAQ